MSGKQNLKRLSSRFSGPYRWVLYLVYMMIFGTIVYSTVDRGWFYAVSQTALYAWIFYLLVKMTYRMQRAAFDNKHLYVFLPDQDLVIPLENIESVEIETLGGLYKVNLYHPEQLGKAFYFKTSLLYPLNHRSKDALFNELRKAITQAKRTQKDYPRNALMS